MKKDGRGIGRRLLAVFLIAAVMWSLQSSSVSAVTPKGAIARGVDVSKHNGEINWGQAAASGIQFAFIKIGSTKSGIDPYFASNITNAQAAGLRTGVYIYSYATTPAEAAAEADLVLQWIGDYTVNYPIVYDIEDKCHKKLSNQQLIDMINAFCTKIDAAGYYPMVYSYRNMFQSKLDICGWDRWIAQYGDSCDYNNNICVWQYSSHGNVKGFKSRVDVNYLYKDYNSLIIPEGFVAHNENVRFYRNWRMQRGWVDYNDTRYYLDGAGNLVRGWFSDENGIYYLNPADGSIARGQCVVDGGEYYFTAEGIQLGGFVVLGEQKFYYDPATRLLMRGWISAEDKTYYADETGRIVTGICTIQEQPYYFDETGALVRNQELELNGVKYVATPEGILVEVVEEAPAEETPAPVPAT